MCNNCKCKKHDDTGIRYNPRGHADRLDKLEQINTSRLIWLLELESKVDKLLEITKSK